MWKTTSPSARAVTVFLLATAFVLGGCGKETPTDVSTTEGPGTIGQAPLLPPTALSGAPKDGAISLQWQASPSAGVTHYNVYVRTEGGSFTLLASAERTNFRAGDLQPNTDYWFQVTAGAEARESSPTRSVNIRTVSDPSILGEDDLSKKKYGEQF